MMDNYPDKRGKQYTCQWNELCAKDRKARGPIEGYEEGNSEVDFSDWEDEKKSRKL
jgi:hypothetical protein